MMIKSKFFLIFIFTTLVFTGSVLAENSFTNSIGMKFVYIQPGTFIMGSPSNEIQRILDNYPYETQLDEKQHRVTLTESYYIQTTEVTQRQWKDVMGTNPSAFNNCGDDCPVENVSWNDVQLFIQKLNKREGTNKLHNEYMLPTEAQWEYACRAGSKTSFANGKLIGLKSNLNLDAIGWYENNSRQTIHPIATRAPNIWGLYDMHGNVSEWCSNSKYRYPSYAVKNPPISYLDSGSNRVFRGGNWSDLPYACRSAYRKGERKTYKNYNLGFRLIKRGR